MTTATRTMAVLTATLVLAGCSGATADDPTDAGSAAPDTGVLVPEYELSVGADLTAATVATVDSDFTMDPTGETRVQDIVPVTYEATNTGTRAHLELQRSGHTLTILASGEATSSPSPHGASGAIGFDLTGIVAKARGAKAFKVTYTCDGSLTTNAHAGALIQVAAGNHGCERYRIVDENGAVDEQDWDRQSSEFTVEAVDGQASWLESAGISISASGGTHGGSATVEATITLTVDPVY